MPLKRTPIIVLLFLIAGGLGAWLTFRTAKEDPRERNARPAPQRDESAAVIRIAAGAEVFFAFDGELSFDTKGLQSTDEVSVSQRNNFGDFAGYLKLSFGQPSEQGTPFDAQLVIARGPRFSEAKRTNLQGILLTTQGEIDIRDIAKREEDEAQASLISTLATLSMVNLGKAGLRSVDEHDAVGVYQARYARMSAGRVSKHWGSYSKLRIDDYTKAENVLCRVIYDFNAEDGWVERAEGSFKRSLINTQGRSVVEASTLKLRRVTGLAKASTIIESLARNAQSKLVTDTGAKITHWREAFDALIHADAEGKDTRLFADLLKELLAADDNAANEFLSFIIDLEAEKKIGESQALVLWSDFVELGSIASQRAIMDLIENPAADDQIRVRALIYAARLPQPSDETLDRMWAIRRAYRGKEGELNALLDNSSLLQIGTMVSNRRVMKVDDSVHVLRICEEANQVIDTHDRVVALEALGNAVHSAALATLERYTLDQNLEVRQAALESIGCFPQDQKLPIVERVYPQIHDPQSRAAAVEALGAGSLNSDLGERTTEWAMAQIDGETSPLVQVQLVKVLAHALPTLRDGRVKDTLKSLYRTNPHIEVRKEIIRILGEEALR